MQLDINQLNKDWRLLLVDDELYNIMGLKILISQAGYESILSKIDHAFNGQEAIDKIKNSIKEGYSYGLIFMDASMPVLDGYQATEHIRNFFRDKNLL